MKLKKAGVPVGQSLFKLHPVLLLILFVFALQCQAFASEPNSGSIGVTVVPTAVGHLVVLHVIEDSPAAQAGLQPGDLIVSVDGFDLKGSKFAQVIKEHLWGKAGTGVNLKFLRPGRKGGTSLRLIRAKLDKNPANLSGVRMVFPEGSGAQGP